MDDLSLAIRKNMERKGSSAAHGRVELLLCALVGLAINQRDTVMGSVGLCYIWFIFIWKAFQIRYGS